MYNAIASPGRIEDGYTKIAYTKAVKNITLSADDHLIERARLRAAREKKTLNAAFRDWLERYAGAETALRSTSN